MNMRVVYINDVFSYLQKLRFVLLQAGKLLGFDHFYVSV